VTAEAACHDVKESDKEHKKCWNTIQWLKNGQIQKHPLYYPGLTLDSPLADFQAIGGTIIESTETSGKLVVRASADKYPIKLKEPGITAAIRILKDKGLFPNEDDDDDLVFGDDDFPLS